MALTATQAYPNDATAGGYTTRFKLTDAALTSPAASPVTTVTISNATLQTSCPKGPLRAIFRAFDDGLPGTSGITKLAALTQAQARALLLGDDSANAVLTNVFSPRATCHIVPRGGSGATTLGKPPTRSWGVDANVDASGRPVLLVSASFKRTTAASPTSPLASADVAYLEVRFIHSQMR